MTPLALATAKRGVNELPSRSPITSTESGCPFFAAKRYQSMSARRSIRPAISHGNVTGICLVEAVVRLLLDRDRAVGQGSASTDSSCRPHVFSRYARSPGRFDAAGGRNCPSRLVGAAGAA